MKLIFTNILLVILSTLVVFLSMGVSISKMQCSKDGRIFIGSEVPNCIQKEELACVMDFQKVSCCTQKEINVSCCPQTNDNSCEGETANIQFDFETLIPSFEFSFKEVSILLYTFSLYEQAYDFSKQFNYTVEIPLSKLYKPELAEIQSFLL